MVVRPDASTSDAARIDGEAEARRGAAAAAREQAEAERELQRLVEASLGPVFKSRFVATEFPTGLVHGGRIDTLALSEDDNPVIIEYKRSVGENVINQGLYYLDWLMDHQAEFKLLVMDQLGKPAADAIDWTAPRLAAIDLQYADTRPERGLAFRLEQRGSLRRITSAEEVARAMVEPPIDTRAWFRGECVRRFGASVAAASWDSVIFDVPGRASLQRVPMLEPLRGTRAHVGELLERCATAAELVDELTST
jgi:hypothetical protein